MIWLEIPVFFLNHCRDGRRLSISSGESLDGRIVMESRRRISLTKSFCLAIEMARGSLRSIGLDGRWIQAEVNSMDYIGGGIGKDRLIILSVPVYPNIDILASCTLCRGEGGEWERGRLEIWKLNEGRQCDDLDKHWHFVCELDDKGQLNVRQGY